jgi:hypothetical protein
VSADWIGEDDDEDCHGEWTLTGHVKEPNLIQTHI